MKGSKKHFSHPIAFTFQLLGLSLGLACASIADTPPPEPADGTYEVVIEEKGQASVTLADEAMTLTWLELNDSRCPEGVQCIVAGQAQLRLQVERAGHDAETVVLVLSADGRRPWADGAARVGDHTLRLMAVEPYPNVDNPPKAGSRSATLQIERAGAEPADGNDG